MSPGLLQRLQRNAGSAESQTRPDPVCGGGRGRFTDDGICLRCVDLAEDERRRIAMDLHDGPLQQLVNMVTRLDMARSNLPPEAEGSREELAQLTQLARVQVADMRRFMFELRPAGKAEFSLVPLLRRYVQDFASHTGIPVEVSLEGDEWSLGEAAEVAVFRIVQESLTNVRKHARASSATVGLRRQGAVAEVEITDNGRGFDVSAARAGAVEKRSLGLASIGDRTAALGGTLTLESRPGQTRVRVIFPVPETPPS